MENQIKVIELHATTCNGEHLDSKVQVAISELNEAVYNGINVVKVHFDDKVKPFNVSPMLKAVCDAFQRAGCVNCVFVPIGGSLGITDVTIDKIEVISDV